MLHDLNTWRNTFVDLLSHFSNHTFLCTNREIHIYFWKVRNSNSQLAFFTTHGIYRGCSFADHGDRPRRYGEFNFRMAIRFSQIADYYQYLKQINGTEYAYAVLNFWVSKFSMDIHWFLFILSLFTLLPFFIGAIRFEQKFSVPVVMQTVFYFTIFYGPSFNAMRQSLAMGWVYLSCSYLFENTSPRKKSLYVLLTWIIAVSFHRTAIIEGVIIFIYLYLHQETTTTGKGLKRFSLILLGSAILLVAFTLLNSGAFASSISKYASYLDGSNSLVQKTIGIREELFL